MYSIGGQWRLTQYADNVIFNVYKTYRTVPYRTVPYRTVWTLFCCWNNVVCVQE